MAKSSSTITLNAACTYVLTSAANDWNGGGSAIHLKGHNCGDSSATINRTPANARRQIRIFALQVPAGSRSKEVTLRNGAQQHGE